MDINANSLPLFSTPEPSEHIQSSIDCAALLAKLAALQRTIAAGTTAGASNATSKAARGYDDNGVPT